jgi:hypothetical protein
VNIELPGLVGPPPPGALIAGFVGEKRHIINNRYQWDALVRDEPIPPPDRLTMRQLDALSGDDRLRYRSARLAFLGDLYVDTPFMAHVEAQLFPLIETNLYSSRATARYGLALDGKGGAGKSTIIEVLLRRWHRDRLCQAAKLDWEAAKKETIWTPGSQNRGLYVPVMVLRLTGTVTERLFLAKAYSYLGVKAPSTGSISEFLAWFLRVLDACGTEVLVIDEFHAFKPYMRNYDEIAQFIKSLMDGMVATLIVSGQDLHANQLLSEGRYGVDGADTSTSRRLSRVDVGYFPLEPGNDDDWAIWTGILEQMDGALLLANQEPGEIVTYAKELHRLNQGALGSLMAHLVRALAAAIDSGQERLSIELLNSILLSNGATMYAHPEDNPKPPKHTSDRPRKGRGRRGPSTKPLTQGRGVKV